ncbi:hypothetical protein D9757_005326 [Collybiopsis confluens]|uniref:rRNA biogenesis protein RRP36 n=1 Tax=Collybiopsis confluens TaxID=2823264 RepID=A0A8H5HL89_9AGAR|nr:hypothetical protein D9757_005326 [Collybiopsis confluens]
MSAPQRKQKAGVGTQKIATKDDADENADAPRVVQWEDEDSLNELPSLEDDLSSLPMGALRRAQKVLSSSKPLSQSSASENKTDSSLGSEDEDTAAQEPVLNYKSRTVIAKRSNKHAPVEITSKKPVTRRRTIVNAQNLQARDPRFLPLAGEFSSDKFHENYRFLSENRKMELSMLRDNLKRARRMSTSSPRDSRYEKEAEVGRLELAVRRAESAVNKNRRDTIEREALRAAKKQERIKQQSGKGTWHMKDSEKKELLVKARYGALAEEGGERAVRKSIEKKRKKIAQKEKKSRPFPEVSTAQSLQASNHDRHENKRRRLVG